MTTNQHAAPWTVRRFLAQFKPRRATPNLLQAQTGTWSKPIMSGRESTARHLFGEAVQWSKLDMLEYDNSPRLRGGWLAEADRRIAQPELDLSELIVARWHGCTPAQWLKLPAHVQVAKRDDYAQARGL